MLEFGFESFVLSQNIVVPLESVMLLLDVRQSENVPRCCKRLDFFVFFSHAQHSRKNQSGTVADICYRNPNLGLCGNWFCWVCHGPAFQI